MSDGAPAFVLPVLRSTARPRRYVLAEEVADDIRGEDLGRIDRLRVRNDTGSRVFLRPGMLFQGRETQSRGTTVGVLLDPRSTADIEVKCVHASHAIVEGATLALSREIAPDLVHQTLLVRDQGLVWASVAEAVAASRGREPDERTHASWPPVSDDLVSALADSSPIEDEVDEVLREIPTPEMQCGIFILGAHGVIAVEILDNPDSWKVVSRAILKRYAHHVRPTPTSPLKARVESETAVGLARDFLNELVHTASRQLTGHSWMVGSPLAEYTTLDGEVIHLVAFRPGSPWEHRSTLVPETESSNLPTVTGTHGFDTPPGLVSQAMGTMESDDAEIAVAGAVAVDLESDLEPSPPAAQVLRRKVLTSGWDPATFQALEHYSLKEFRGDRSAAVRFLVRHGLRRRGYMGPQLPRAAAPFSMPILDAENAPSATEVGRTKMETRIRDLERIAQTTRYAGWLRERAHLELERMASAAEDELLRDAARSALDRIAPMPPSLETREPKGIEAPPTAPPVDTTDLLQRALTASAGGKYLQALALFDEILEVEPFNMTALLGRAVAFRRVGRAKEALAGLDLVLRLEPRNAAALLNRGRILQGRGDLKGALDAFDLLVEVAPNDWDVWMERGDALLRMGRDEDALRSYAEALRRNPDDEKLQRRTRALEKARTASAPGGPQRITMPRGVEEGRSYLAKERRPELCYRVFKALAGQRVPSLLITHEPPERVRQEPGLAGVRVLGLSHTPGADVYSPTALGPLSRVVERFVGENHGRGVILLDGLESLIANNGFRNTILFVEHLNELILQCKAIFLLSVVPENLPERELAFLERNLKILS